jgi:hypothetical protein
MTFDAYNSDFLGGVRVAMGDVNGDGVPDIITAPGPSGGPDVKVFDGRTGSLIREFAATNIHFLGGLYVAAGDVLGKGYASIITAADAGGGPQVEVWDGMTGALIYSFYALNVQFTGGARVAAGDVNGDGHADIIVGAGPGGGPQVEVFSGASGQLMVSYLAYNVNFAGGVYVAAGDVTGAGKADVITGTGAHGGPQVSVFDGLTGALEESFFAYNPSFYGGVRVGFLSDPTGAGNTELITGPGSSGGPQVSIFNAKDGTLLDSFFALAPTFLGGVFVGGE